MRRFKRAAGSIEIPILVQDSLYPTSETGIWFVMGGLYADGTDFGSGEWSQVFDNNGNPASENKLANRYEQALNAAGLTYTRGGSVNSYFRIYGIDPNFSITNVPGANNATSLQRHAFLAQLIAGEGSQAGMIMDDSNPDYEVHLQIVGDMLVKDGITPIYLNQPHRIEIAAESFYIVQKYPHVVWGRVPGGKPVWASIYT